MQDQPKLFKEVILARMGLSPAPISRSIPFPVLPYLERRHIQQMAIRRPQRGCVRQDSHIECVSFHLICCYWYLTVCFPHLVPAILTNIPGPPESAELAGSRILRWTALPPQGDKGTVGIGMQGSLARMNVSLSLTAWMFLRHDHL